MLATAGALLTLAAVALSSGALTPVRAALLPHIDPLQAVKAMRHSNPPPPSISPDDQWQRYQHELATAKEQAMKQRFQHAGPWEAIAAQEFGVFAKPDGAATAAPVPVPAPALPTPAVHSPVHVLPTPPKIAAVSHAPQVDAGHSKDASPAPAPAAAAPAVAAPPTATQPAAATAVAQGPKQKPILPHDTVMKLIRRYTDAIAKYRAEHNADAAKAARIAQAAAAWAAANPPGHHPAASKAGPAPPHPAVPPHSIAHHRMGVPTHKMPPPPTHALNTPSAAKPKHTQFVLKFSGVCVDNRTATALGKHNDPHHQQPLQHHMKYHRRGLHSDAHTSSEIPWCSLKAQSQEIVTRIHPKAGVDMSVSKMVGSVAHLDLFDLSILSETEFVARGNLSFGSTRHRPHSVAMESAGSARVWKFETGSRAFTGQFQVTGGSGGFEGHRGSLTLNGVLKSLNRVEALVTGVLYPPPSPPPLSPAALRAQRMTALKPSPFYRRATATPPPSKAADANDDDDSDDDDSDDDDSDDDDGDGDDADADAEETKPKAKPQSKPKRVRLRI